MTPRKIRVTVEFWADMPADELGADSQADTYTSAIERAVSDIPGVAEGSVAVPEWDEVPVA